MHRTLWLALLLLLTAPAQSAQFIQQTYPVYGFNAGQLIAQMQRNGPFSQGLGHGAWARTKAQYHYNANLMPSPDGRCHIRSLNVTMTIIMTLPKWVNKKQGRACLQKRWDVMKSALVKHENNHKKRYQAMESAIIQALRRTPPQYSCPQMHTTLDRTMEATAQTTHHWQNNYDRRTHSGQSEGVRLDPCFR